MYIHKTPPGKLLVVMRFALEGICCIGRSRVGGIGRVGNTVVAVGMENIAGRCRRMMASPGRCHVSRCASPTRCWKHKNNRETLIKHQMIPNDLKWFHVSLINSPNRFRFESEVNLVTYPFLVLVLSHFMGSLFKQWECNDSKWLKNRIVISGEKKHPLMKQNPTVLTG